MQGQYAWGRNIDPETNTYNNVTTFNNYYQLYAELNVFDGFATSSLRRLSISLSMSIQAALYVSWNTSAAIIPKCSLPKE